MAISIDLDGKVALVTGAASGIGEATARMFADGGAAVVVADIDPKGHSVADAIVDGGGRAVFVEVDVARPLHCDQMVATALETFGRLDFAHNNAGTGISGRPTLWDTTEDDWDRIFAVNAKGVWLAMKAELPALRDTRGAIVNTASVAALRIAAREGAYSATKAAVIALTHSAAKEAGVFGVRVNAVAPGAVNTPLFPSELRDRIAQITPLGRVSSPDEIAAAVVWLCSPAASYVTGAVLTIDGALI